MTMITVTTTVTTMITTTKRLKTKCVETFRNYAVANYTECFPAIMSHFQL